MKQLSLKKLKLSDENNFRKNFIWNMLGMTFNSFNSLFYMVIVTRINGTNEAGIFTLAFSVACLVYYIGIYSGRVYQVTDQNGIISDKEYILQRVVCFVLLLLISAFYCIFNRYSGEKLVIFLLLCLMKGFEALSDVFYGVLQKHNELYRVGVSLFLKSLISIVSFLVLDLVTKNLIISILFMDLVWIVIFLIYDIPRTSVFLEKKEKVYLHHIRDLFLKGFYIFIVNFLSVYIVNAPKYAAGGLLSNSFQAIFGIILMPATLMSLAVQYFIQPYLLKLSNHFVNGEIKKFNSLVLKLLMIIILFGVICLIGVYFFGIPILSLIYGIDLNAYRFDLEIIIIGSVLYPMSIILSSALTTVNITFLQFILYLITTTFSFFICPILISDFKVAGASLAYLCTMLVHFILYFGTYVFLFKRNILFKYKK